MSSYRMKYKIGQVEHHIPVSDDLQDIDLDDKFDLDSDWCYIYPNNGTAENPGTVALNSVYIVANPFPGYIVECKPELYVDGAWGFHHWAQADHFSTGNWMGFGVSANQHDNGNITVRVGSQHVYTGSSYGNSLNGSSWPSNSPTTGVLSTPTPCRIKVWKIGKIPT